jgi:hypothetical protein
MNVSKIVIWAVIISSLISAFVAFNKFYIHRQYLVEANVSCDTQVHSCFIGDDDNTPRYYQKVTRLASTIPECNGWAGQCPELSCTDRDLNCTVEYCIPGGSDTCSGPTASTK